MQDLGAFELTDRLAAGGMGQVWNGRHRRTGRAVAIKVISDAEQVRSLVQFEQEVRAVAKLEHPNIVAVLDHGRLTEGAGAPFLVMERAHGTLADAPPDDWPGVQKVLAAVLDALAHSHARGVLHRDLKPSNILVFDGATYKLADFGIAVALQHPEHPERAGVSGTPAYMAPEMFLGQWRRFGPWTDLYAVGILAWELVTGERPFDADDLAGFQTAHLHQPPPAFVPRFAVPTGLEVFLLALLRKDPGTRFQRAIDAAAALVALGPAVVEGQREGTPGATADAGTLSLTFSLTLAEAVAQTATLDVDAVGPPPAAVPPSEPVRIHAPPPAPVPARWRQPLRARWDLTDVGLGLYGLRTVPMVDRDAQRDQLWRAVRAAREGGSHGFLLSGVAGTGKSRLARWLCERAHEIGGAAVLTATHGEQAGPRDGILPMLSRFLRADGLARGPLARHLATLLPDAAPALRLELVDALMPLAGARPPLAPVTTALLQHVAAQRTVVVWLDDLHASEATCAVLEQLVQASLPGVVCVGTLRGDVAHGPVLTRLLEHEALPTLQVTGLTGEDRRELVSALLGLDDALVHEVDARTEGNPLFAVQLVADWVQRQILVPKDGGFALKPGVRTPPPRQVRQVWADRIEDLLQGRPSDDQRALWMAAVLGTNIADREWTGACARAGIAVPADLPGELEVRHLGRVVEGGWSFAHSMLVETLVLEAEDELPTLRLHAAAELCAQAEELEERGQIAMADTLLERAGVLLEGNDERASARLRAQWGQVKRKLGETEAALQLLRSSLDALDGLDLGRALRAIGVVLVGMGDQERGRAHYERARPLLAVDPVETAQLLLEVGYAQAADNEHQEALATLTRALEIAGERARPRIKGTALCNLGVVHSDLGDLESSKACYDQAQMQLELAGDRRTLAMVHSNQAILMHTLGRLDQVQPLFLRALAVNRELANRRSEGIVLHNLGSLAQAEGRLRDARDFVTASIEAARDVRSPASVCAGSTTLGNVLQALGEHEAAVESLQTAAEIASSIGQALLHGRALGELGDVLRLQGRLQESRVALEQALAVNEQADDPAGRALFLATRLAVDAELGRAEDGASDRTVIEEVLERRTQPAAVGMIHCHLSRAAAHAGDLESARVELERAEAVLERLAMAPGSSVGRAVAEARELLGSLG